MTAPARLSEPCHALIVEDDREMRRSLVDLLDAAGWRVTETARAEDALKQVRDVLPDVILSDLRMPGMGGMELLSALEPAYAPPVVLISAHGDIPMAVEAMTRGAYSFVEKPCEPRRLLSILTHAADQHRMRDANARLRERLMRLAGLDRMLLGQSAAIVRLREDVLDLADTRAAVLIRGETGTGKELVANALHDLGGRAQGPFVALGTAQLTGESLARGVMAARGGTLFLDEICACPAEVQAMLLRVIEDRAVASPETGRPVDLDLRIVSATNEDVDTAVADGRLRADLLFRLNTVPVAVPPLRERREDVALLATHFTGEMAKLYEIAPPTLSPDDITALLAHDWPGNVRELRSVAERRVLAARRGAGSFAEAIAPGEPAEEVPSTLREAVAALERRMIGRAIQAHEGRMDAVAEALGIGRRTLNEKIVKLGLDKEALL